MAQSTILAPGSSVATSSAVVVAAGGQAVVGLFTAGGPIPGTASAQILMETPEGNLPIGDLSPLMPAQVIQAPGTFYVRRTSGGGDGTGVGVFSET